MNYLSLFSGIEAASVAWRPLGWRPVGFAEIEKFPCAVLAHHYPEVPNFGDVNQFREWPDADVDVLVGGSPCQSFSVAGLRQGLADPRGNLALTYLGCVDRYRPEWVVWENVPGVLSVDGGRAFGAFLGGLAELGYGFAYRILDAQFVRVDGFGRAVPQRRRRVFVVGNLRDWRRAAAVLFERESLSWDSAPRRQAGQGIAPTISARPTGGGGLGTDFDLDGGLTAVEVAPSLDASYGKLQGCSGQDLNHGHSHLIPFGGNNTEGSIEVATAVNAHGVPHGRLDFESETFVAHSLRADGFDAGEDGTGRGTPLVPIAFAENSRAELRLCGGDGAVSSQLTTGGGKPGQGQPCIAFSCKDDGGDAECDLSPTLRAGGFTTSHANAGVMPAIAFGIRSDASRDGDAKTPSADAEGRVRLRNPGVGIYSEIAPTVDAGQPHSVAFAQGVTIHGTDKTARAASYTDVAGALRARAPGSQENSSTTAVHHGWAVRRLTPVECERLQGFPDGYTQIPWRGKNGAPDGPRYKALGNSFAVNVVRWIGQRIAMVDAIDG